MSIPAFTRPATPAIKRAISSAHPPVSSPLSVFNFASSGLTPTPRALAHFPRSQRPSPLDYFSFKPLTESLPMSPSPSTPTITRVGRSQLRRFTLHLSPFPEVMTPSGDAETTPRAIETCLPNEDGLSTPRPMYRQVLDLSRTRERRATIAEVAHGPALHNCIKKLAKETIPDDKKIRDGIAWASKEEGARGYVELNLSAAPIASGARAVTFGKSTTQLMEGGEWRVSQTITLPDFPTDKYTLNARPPTPGVVGMKNYIIE